MNNLQVIRRSMPIDDKIKIIFNAEKSYIFFGGDVVEEDRNNILSIVIFPKKYTWILTTTKVYFYNHDFDYFKILYSSDEIYRENNFSFHDFIPSMDKLLILSKSDEGEGCLEEILLQDDELHNFSLIHLPININQRSYLLVVNEEREQAGVESGLYISKINGGDFEFADIKISNHLHNFDPEVFLDLTKYYFYE